MSPTTNNPSTILGARASTAGDVFHELWGLRAAFGLITPKTELKAVTVEGIAAPPGSTHLYDGVDCGLFYGDISLERASRVEFVQLKHSTAEPDTAWTVARLVASSAKKSNNSVIRKLATDFANVQGKMARGATLVIKLISNQPLGSDVGDAIANIRAGDHGDPNAVKFATASGLSGAQLLAFLDALDFSAMGSGSRSALQDAIAREVSQMSGDKADPLVLQMQSCIRKLMLPEAAQEIITGSTVLSWFGVSTPSALFPARADFPPMGDPIQRAPANEVRDALLAGNLLVCLHGLAGCGKTTTMRQVQLLLPAGSVSVIFDCYGAGRYIHTNDRRHLPENAFLQIINDVAMQQGVPLLLVKQSSQLVNIRAFIERIKQSAELLAKASPGGFLAIFIDAADNSVSAAERDPTASACFVWEIANADLRELPANVRLIVSSRSGRRDRLRLPLKTQYIECPPFTRAETRVYVDKRMPGLSDDWLDQFHALSNNGIPRVQVYAFTKGGTSPVDVLDALRPSGKGLDTVLQELFQVAAKKGGQDFYERCVAAIDTLPGPIPLTHLAAVCGTTDAVVRDFMSDVSPTLRIEENDTVTIADEDVEDFLAAEGCSRHAQTLSEACAYFEPIYRTDAYAATHYCDLLAEAGRAAEILPLIQKDVVPAGISDPIVRREVQVRRLRLALAACRKANNAADILKVILLSAEGAKDEAALRKLLEEEAALSVRFASGSLLRLVLADRDTYPRQGSILIHDALRAALEGDKITANERLHLYFHWMRRREEAESEHDWKLPHEDYVVLAQAITVLRGPSHFIERIRDWRPPWFRLHVGLDLVSQLITCGRRDIVVKAYTDRLVPRSWNLLLTVPLALSGYAIQKDRLETELSALRKRLLPDLRRANSHGGETWKCRYLEVIVTACEIGYALGVNRAILQRVLEFVLNHRTSPSSSIQYTDAPKIDIALRAWLLQRELKPKTAEELKTEAADLAKAQEAAKRSGMSVKLADSAQFLAFAINTNAPPEKKKPGRKKKHAHVERNTTDEREKRAVGAIYHIYAARIAVLAEAAKAPINGKPATDLMLGIDSYTFDREYYGDQFRSRAAQSLARLMHLNGLSAEYLFECAAGTLRSRQEGPFAHRSLPVWQDFLARPEVHQKILDEIMSRSKAIKLARTSAQDKTSALLGFGKLVLNFSPRDAQALFEDAVVITQEIDREAMIQIEFVAGLTTRHDDFPPALRKELAVAHAAYVTDVAIRLDGEEHFPWTKAISAIYDLSPEVSLAALSQWQDEGVTDFDDSLAPLLHRLAKDGSNPVLPSALFGLLKHVPERSFFSLIENVSASADPARKDAFDLLSKKLLMDAFPSQRATLIEGLAERLPRDLKPGDMTTRLKAEAELPKEGDEKTPKGKTELAVPVAFPADADFSAEAGIRAAVETAKAEERIQDRYISLDTILLAAREKITAPACRLMFLNVVSEFKGDGFDASDRTRVILDTLQAWKSPAIDRWKELQLPSIIRKNLWGLVRWLRESNISLQKLIQASGVKGQALIDVIASGLEDRSGEYSSGALFGLCEIMAPSLTNEDANELTKWYIARLGERVPKDVVARFSLPEMPNDLEQAVGRFLFAQFSDVDLRVRWRAAHCLRALTKLQGGWTLKSVLEVYNQRADGAFRLREAPFYWLGARLFTVMTAARISLDQPEAIAPLARTLFTIATDDELPHYLIRGYAKDALLALLAHDPTRLSAREKMALAAVNRPKVKPRPRKKGGHFRELERTERKGARFQFDSLDTIPYWYSPLYGHFAELTPEKCFNTLERWLIDVWKVDPESNWWDKEPRRKRYDPDSMASYHGHGSLPTVERYGTYLEWHAMFCGLGEWLEAEPLIVPEDHSDSLEYWARRWKPTEAPTWLADRRGYRPLDKEFIADKGGDDKHWLRRVPKHRFQAVVCGGTGATPSVLTVYGDWTVSGKTRQIDIEISTALVEPASASALLRTLSGVERRMWLPTEHEERDDNESYELPPFRLYGWLSRAGSDTEYDQHDPLRAEVSELKIRPATSLLSKYKVYEEGLPVSVWSKDAAQEWFRYEAWSDWASRDSERRGRERAVGSNGYRLLVRKDALHTVMRRENLDLIADIEIERRLESEYGEPSQWDDKKRRRTSRKILVFRQSGEIEDETGRIGTWR